MAAARLDVGATVRYGWETTKANLALVVLVTLLAGLITAVPAWIANSLDGRATALSALLRLTGAILSVLVGIGVVRISLRLHDGQRVELGDLLRADWPLFWRYLAATIVYSLIVAAGLVLLIVPGVILAVRYVLFGYFIVERNARPVEALKMSAAATQGAYWELSVLALALFGIILLGALLLGVGLLVAFPVVYLAAARAYRTLTGGPAPQPQPAA